LVLFTIYVFYLFAQSGYKSNGFMLDVQTSWVFGINGYRPVPFLVIF